MSLVKGLIFKDLCHIGNKDSGWRFVKVLFVNGLTAFGSGGVQVETGRLLHRTINAGLDAGIAIDHPLEIPNLAYFPLSYPPGNNAGAQVTEAVSAFHPDVVHVLGGGIGLLNQISDVVKDIPWVFTTHNVPPNERAIPAFHGHNIFYYTMRDIHAIPSILLWKRFLKNAKFSAVISHSRTVSASLYEYGCPVNKVCQIPFGFDVPEISAAANSPFEPRAYPKILTVAGLIHHKGLHDVVSIMPEVRRRFVGAKYLIIGERRDKGYAAYLEKLITASGVGDCVKVIVNAPEAIKMAALNDADLYVQPSHEEGFCLAFAEAAAISPLLVGTRTGEMAGFVEGDSSAKVVDPKAPSELMRAISELLELPSDPNSVQNRQAQLKKRYSWENYFQAHLALYDRSVS